MPFKFWTTSMKLQSFFAEKDSAWTKLHLDQSTIHVCLSMAVGNSRALKHINRIAHRKLDNEHKAFENMSYEDEVEVSCSSPAHERHRTPSALDSKRNVEEEEVLFDASTC